MGVVPVWCLEDVERHCGCGTAWLRDADFTCSPCVSFSEVIRQLSYHSSQHRSLRQIVTLEYHAPYLYKASLLYNLQHYDNLPSWSRDISASLPVTNPDRPP